MKKQALSICLNKFFGILNFRIHTPAWEPEKIILKKNT